MKISRVFLSLLVVFVGGLSWSAVPIDIPPASEASGIAVRAVGERISLHWDCAADTPAELVLNLAASDRVIERMSVAGSTILRDSAPVFLVTVGSRSLDSRHGWVRFFDKVPTRPYREHRATLAIRGARVSTEGRSATVAIGGLSAGEFAGELRITVYDGSRLVHVEAVLSTEADARAIVYDAGLVSPDAGWIRTSFMNAQDVWQEIGSAAVATPQAVRLRTVVAETDAGAVAVFPAPHQYFYPLDFADNFGFTWSGTGYRGRVPERGLGIRQPLGGDGRFVPWFNAPPGTKQHLAFFCLLAEGKGRAAWEETARFTRHDRFKPLPGYQTFTSHYHIEHTLDYLEKQAGQPGIPAGLEDPGFKQVFKKMGVDIVHLAEFHRGRTPRLKAPERLEQLRLMHTECARLSEPDFLLLPGEEPNVHLGGHWISFFPKPVYWVLNRGAGEPFVEERPGFGKVYHVGSAADVLRLFELEQGLNWTAHARIKGSTGFPDAYRERDFFRSERFLGAAWKSMPADLSRDRLGERVLDLLDDMANWGPAKNVLGEVDVFKVRPDYELWGHMNINYLRLDSVPRFEDGWQPVLDVLRRGDFFVSTGEILLPEVTVSPGGIDVTVEWTFPLDHAEIVSGDGRQVFRERVPLRDTRPFGKRRFRFDSDLAQRSWARLEVWDVARNGVFTQPTVLAPP